MLFYSKYRRPFVWPPVLTNWTLLYTAWKCNLRDAGENIYKLKVICILIVEQIHERIWIIPHFKKTNKSLGKLKKKFLKILDWRKKKKYKLISFLLSRRRKKFHKRIFVTFVCNLQWPWLMHWKEKKKTKSTFMWPLSTNYQQNIS